MTDLPPATGVLLGNSVEDIVGTAWLLGHDLKSPVALIISVMEVLIATYGDDPQMVAVMPLLRGALAAANRQHNMVGDMLDLARLETDHYELERASIDIVALLREMLVAEDYAISTKKLKLELDLPASPLIVSLDRELFLRVMSALIDNTIKFTVRDDLLTICIRQVGENVQIIFSDNGRVIFPDFEQHIIERAPQWEKRQAGSRTSVGLGLPFTNAVARAHGGTFFAKTDPVTNTTSFTITIPISPTEQQNETKMADSSHLDDSQIGHIIQNVMRELSDADSAPVVRRGAPPVMPRPIVGKGDGMFHDPDSAVDAARSAYEQLADMPLDVRKHMIDAMRATAREHAGVLAQFAVEETGMGRVEDKIQKNLLTANKTPGPEYLEPHVWTGDDGLTLTEYAPYGVIASITPTTNPTSTIINNSISMISAGNAVVFNAHPGAKACSAYTIQLLNQAIQNAGGPPNLLTCVVEPTIDSAQALMVHKQVRLLAVTGGIGVVRQAMKVANVLCVLGRGNPPVVVDETADIDQAGRDVVRGGSFDNNLVCTTEKTCIVVESVLNDLVESMTRHGGYLITSWQLKRLMKSIFEEDKALANPV